MGRNKEQEGSCPFRQEVGGGTVWREARGGGSLSFLRGGSSEIQRAGSRVRLPGQLQSTPGVWDVHKPICLWAGPLTLCVGTGYQGGTLAEQGNESRAGETLALGGRNVGWQLLCQALNRGCSSLKAQTEILPETGMNTALQLDPTRPSTACSERTRSSLGREARGTQSCLPGRYPQVLEDGHARQCAPRNGALFFIWRTVLWALSDEATWECGWKYSWELIWTPPDFKLQEKCLFHLQKISKLCAWQLIFADKSGVSAFFPCRLCITPVYFQEKSRFFISPPSSSRTQFLV